MASRVDLNADLGEFPGRSGDHLDRALLEIVSSANVACGGHAGDGMSMRRVAELATLHDVAVGAHVSYPDREHFGRLERSFTPQALLDALRVQVDELLAAAADVGTAVRYLKPHGALYHASVVNDAPAAILVALAQEYGLPVLTQCDGTLACTAATAGVAVYGEFFADRAYEASGRLRSRSDPGAVLTDPEVVIDRVLQAVRQRTVLSHSGTRLTVAADSVCLHSDTPGAVALARQIRDTLDSVPVTVRSFVDVVP